MWCHLCSKDYPDFEDFKNHVIQKHQNSSEFCKSSDSEESEHENAGASDVDNEDNNKTDDSMDAFNFSPGYFDENDTNINTSVLSTSPKKMDVNTGTSDVKVTIFKKSPKKRKTPVLKKRVRRKKNKVVFNKKRNPRRKKSPLHQEETSKHSENDETDQSESFITPDLQGNVGSQLLLKNNCINSQSSSTTSNNYAIPQSVSNNPLLILNPYSGQSMNNYVIGNQAAQPSYYVVNPVTSKPASSKNEKGFDLSSENILKWLVELKVLCKNIKFPLPPSLFNTVKTVHKTIFDMYCTTTINEETSAVMKVYEELDCMIHKHVNFINNTISVL